MTEDGPDGKAGKRKAARPEPKPATRSWLINAASFYLDRYPSSEANLRQVLLRKVRRRTGAAPDEPALALVDEVVALCVTSGLIDDRRYAEAAVVSGRRRGRSTRQIHARLDQRGVDRDLTAAAMSSEEEDAERLAAVRYAQRRRLGPYRTREKDGADDKDVAAMVRAGFSLRLARWVVGHSQETLEADEPEA